MTFRDHQPADLNDEISDRRAAHREPLGSLSLRVPRFGHGSRVPGWDDAVDLTKDPAVIPDPATTPVPEDLRREIEAAMAKYPDRRSAAIPSLHAAQAVHGWCSPEAIQQVAAVMRLTPAYLTSVASFYDMFELHPKHTHDVFVCTNISCSILGADEFYDAMAAAAEGQDVDVRSFECLGACDIGPMASVDGEYVGPLELADAERIVEDLAAGRPVLKDKQLRYRPSVDPNVERDGSEFSEPDHSHRADTAGLTSADEAADRPGPSAPLEIRPHDQSET
ncbi:MAG TPA: NAD(P)H-dependent oxidoreductase subunit E [Solirubrobacteraceae bacterium]|jgi:NADH:ubiquinone oxidoreductase subunit E|nr:NAD(P)H-dependent oxidoreductase subunit E [Solirubrobacteraceae bacterium]